jgi:hypothetical protein
MVEGVSALKHTLSVLRSRLATGAGLTRAGAGRGKGATTKPPAGGGQNDSHVATLAGRLAGITVNEPQRSKAALRLFVEAVLLDDFGGQYVLAADFQLMVEKVASAIEQDPGLQSCLKESIAELSAGGDALC